MVGMVRGGTVCDWAGADYVNEGVRSLYNKVLSACVWGVEGIHTWGINGFRQRIAKALSCNVHPKGGGRAFITQHQINIVHCSRYQEQVNVKYWNNYSWVSPSMYLTSVRVSM